MSDRFKVNDIGEQYNSEESEDLFQQINSTEGFQYYNSGISPQVQSYTELGEGEISVKKDSFSYFVPANFSLFGNKYSISDSMRFSHGKMTKAYKVKAQDGSILKLEITTRKTSPNSSCSTCVGQYISIKIETVNKTGDVNVALVTGPNLPHSSNVTNDVRRAFNNLRNTQLWKFISSFPSFDSLGPINPNSILTNVNILLRPTLNKRGFQTVSELYESEALDEAEWNWPRISDVAKCGVGVVKGAITGGRAGSALGPWGTAGGVVVGGVVGGIEADCIKTGADIYKDWSSDKPIFTLPPEVAKTGIGKAAQDAIRGAGVPRCTTSQTLAYINGVLTCVPKAIPIPPEKIRWIQTILKIANGESQLVIDGLLGPKTREAIKRFQQTFGLNSNATINQETTNALIQHGLNHIAKQTRLAVDGKMGPNTINEIKRFQSTNNSGPIDGIVGPLTRAAMVNVLTSAVPVSGEASLSGGEYYYGISEKEEEQWIPIAAS